LLGPVKIIKNKFQINGFNLMNAIMSAVFPPPEPRGVFEVIDNMNFNVLMFHRSIGR